MTVRFTPRARDDLTEILEYIAEESPTGAERVRRAIFDTTALIATRPHLGVRNAKAPSGADLTFATLQAARSQSERQIQSSTRINILASGPLIPTFAKVFVAKGMRMLESDH